MPIDERTAARLLSGRDEPSVLEQEAIFEAVMRGVAPPKARSPWRWAWVPSLAALAAALFMVLSPRATSESEFAVRGGTSQGVFSAHCMNEHGDSDACSAGTPLHLELEPPAGRPFLALLARRPDGAVVWYFPQAGQPMPNVAGQHAGAPWSEAPRLAVDAPAGPYTWYAVFAERSLTRDELKQALGEELQGDDSITVIERPLAVERRP